LFLCAFGAVFYCSILLDYMEVLGVRKIVRHFQGEPDPEPVLCLKGPYRHCRHPVYLATVASLWIGPVMTTGRLEFAFLVTIYVLIGTWLEEKDTRKEVGEVYDLYRDNVPMWIPRLTPWRGDGKG
jgi:protein-S-isoprenylcysteine O-methyltransferase Ste14